MWIVEVNFVGRRFTHEVFTRRSALRLRHRRFGWRPSQMHHPHAA
jgi:hypothetical protein